MGIVAGLGSLVGSALGYFGQQGTNAANARLNQKQMDWETQMSNTAMQRRVVDLRQAGLNPMLAVSQGGASTPGMSPIAMQNPAGPGVTQGITNATQAMNLQADTRLKNANAAQVESNTSDDPALARSLVTNIKRFDLENAITQSRVGKQTVENLQSQYGLNMAALPGVEMDSMSKDLDFQTKQALMEQLIAKSLAEYRQVQGNAQAISKFQNSDLGQLFYKLGGPEGIPQMGVNAISNAGSLFKLFKR